MDFCLVSVQLLHDFLAVCVIDVLSWLHAVCLFACKVFDIYITVLSQFISLFGLCLYIWRCFESFVDLVIA